MLFSLPFLKKEKPSQPYFGLFLKEKELVGFILKKQSNGLTVLQEEKANLTNGWDNLLEDVDALLFSLESKANVHCEEVIFFVYSNVINQETKSIKKEHLSLFKTILKQLELKPLGYIECHEAISHHHKQKDQIPLTAILVELDVETSSVFIYKAGEKVSGKTFKRTESIVSDLEQAFQELRADTMLPSRIILYDSANLHNESTKIVTHQWDEDLFVQFPRVEVVKHDQLHQSLIEVFKEQIFSDNTKQIPEETQAVSDSVSEEKSDEPKEVMGFVIGDEVAEKEAEAEEESEEEFVEQTQETRSKMPVVPALLGNVKNIFSKIRIPGKVHKGYFPIVAGIIGLILIYGSLEFFFHKAQIDILFPSQTLAKVSDVKSYISGGGDVSIKSATVSASYSEKKSTTGKKDIGEKAKGDIILNNFDDKEHVFSKGTVLQVGGVKFSLDDEVKVKSATSSASGSSQRIITAGQASGKVTAVEIGPEGNIARGKTLSIADLDSSKYYATNDSAFAGGTKKQIQTVSKQDIETLKETIMEKAKNEAGDKIKQETNGSESIISDLTNSTLSGIKLSKELGEESNEVTITATVNTNYFTYNQKDIQNYVNSQIQGEVPAGFKVDPDKITFEVDNVKRNKDNVSFTIDAKALAIKVVDTKEVMTELKGKSKASVEKILKEKFAASGYEIKISPGIPPFGGSLPFFTKNITIKISSL